MVFLPVRCAAGIGVSDPASKGSYTMEFDEPEGKPVILELDTADAVEVFQNGRYLDKRLWAPWRVDLTAGLLPGKNTLELRVTGTLSGFLYGYNPSGLRAVKLYSAD